MLPSSVLRSRSSRPDGARMFRRAISRALSMLAWLIAFPLNPESLSDASPTLLRRRSSQLLAAVVERGEARADVAALHGVEVRDDQSFAVRQALAHLAPGAHDHGIAVGLASVRMPSFLRGRDDGAEVLDG